MYGSCQRSAGITPRYASAAALTSASISSRSSSRHRRISATPATLRGRGRVLLLAHEALALLGGGLLGLRLGVGEALGREIRAGDAGRKREQRERLAAQSREPGGVHGRPPGTGLG